MVNHKPCSVAEAQYLDAMHTFQKVIYNVCSCSVAVLSGLRPHEGSEERESYHLSDEVPDFT